MTPIDIDFAPMLASPANLSLLQFPLLASPKLDGIRAVVRGQRLVSRKLLDIPNKHVQHLLNWLPDGFDGELIDGPPNALNVYRRTNSLVMSHDKPDVSQLHLYVFDDFSMPTRSYRERFDNLQRMFEKLGHASEVLLLQQELIHDRDQLDAYEASATEQGYEGIMLRSLGGTYKFGRSTAREGILLKLKRFEDSEAEVIRIEEEMFNGNAAERDNLGRTKRSTAAAGKVGKGTMGALVVRDLKTGVEFNIGSGFTAAERAASWKPGDIVKYKFFPVGVKDKPRHPVFIGLRSKLDL